jgi:hypothetical protein
LKASSGAHVRARRDDPRRQSGTDRRARRTVKGGTPTPVRLRDAGNLARRINDCDASVFVSCGSFASLCVMAARPSMSAPPVAPAIDPLLSSRSDLYERVSRLSASTITGRSLEVYTPITLRSVYGMVRPCSRLASDGSKLTWGTERSTPCLRNLAAKSP